MKFLKKLMDRMWLLREVQAQHTLTRVLLSRKGFVEKLRKLIVLEIQRRQDELRRFEEMRQKEEMMRQAELRQGEHCF